MKHYIRRHILLLKRFRDNILLVKLVEYNTNHKYILKDGGCSCPGDIAKAIGAGADFVMLGGMLAGHDQSGGEIIEKDGKKRKLFYGMSSSTAMKKHKVGKI